MRRDTLADEVESQRRGSSDEPIYEVKISRRSFIQLVGAGLLITVTEGVSYGQEGGQSVAARVHLNEDGMITVMTGK